jgi:hypothetical protein
MRRSIGPRETPDLFSGFGASDNPAVPEPASAPIEMAGGSRTSPPVNAVHTSLLF